MKVWLVEFCDYNQSYISLVTISRELAINLTKEEYSEKGNWTESPIIDREDKSFFLSKKTNKVNDIGYSYTDCLTFLIKEHEVKE